MPVIFSVLFAALILVACFKLFFEDLKDLRTDAKNFCWWFSFEFMLELSCESYERGWRFPIWLFIGVIGGALLYYRLSN